MTYPCHEARLTPAEQTLNDWLRLDNHFLARALSIAHNDDRLSARTSEPRAAYPRAVAGAGATNNQRAGVAGGDSQ